LKTQEEKELWSNLELQACRTQSFKEEKKETIVKLTRLSSYLLQMQLSF